MTEKQITHYIGDSCEGGHYETPETPAMTNQTPADALEAAIKTIDLYFAMDAETEKHITDSIRHAQDVAARYAVVEAERRVKLIAEAMRTLVDSDEYLIHARTECDCYAHNGARAALAEAQEQTKP